MPKPRDRKRTPAARGDPAGLAARTLAIHLVAGVTMDGHPLEQVLGELSSRPQVAAMEARDRALARAIAATVLRRQGELELVLNSFLERPLPADKGRLWPILLAAAAQLLFLDMPPHAVVDLAVEATRRDRGARRFAKLTNAVLRRVAEKGKAILVDADGTRRNVPDWLWQRWSKVYGEGIARRIAEASLIEAPLDITMKAGGEAAQTWAQRLGGVLLPTGSVRLHEHGRVEDLAGYAEGAWWVQDAAAALVHRAAGEVVGREVADLCAAPGGKTAGLAAAGARVTAIDISPARLDRLRTNLRRLHLDAEVVQADVATWSPARTFDVVVLDAPCSATGTIRRHPDVLRLKRPDDIARMAKLQGALLENAAKLVRPGGLLVYATCSLEPEEGAEQITRFLDAHPEYAREPIRATDIGVDPDWLTPDGAIRTLPFHLALEPRVLSGLDGFFVARLRRRV